MVVGGGKSRFGVETPEIGGKLGGTKSISRVLILHFAFSWKLSFLSFRGMNLLLSLRLWAFTCHGLFSCFPGQGVGGGGGGGGGGEGVTGGGGGLGEGFQSSAPSVWSLITRACAFHAYMLMYVNV